MLHSYCNECEYFDEVFRECSSLNCEFTPISYDSTTDLDYLDNEEELNDFIHDFFDQCDEDFR